MKDLSLHDFGITIKLKPDAQDRAMLEANIQAEITAGNLSTTDGIDIRKIPNIALANEMLKIRKEKHLNRIQERELEKIEAQGKANAEAAVATSQAKQQEIAFETESKKEVLLMERENRRLEILEEKMAKKELMADEYFYKTGIEVAARKGKREDQEYAEDRKDERTRIQATQQSKMKAEQSKEGGGQAIDFESANTTLTGDFGLDDFRT